MDAQYLRTFGIQIVPHVARMMFHLPARVYIIVPICNVRAMSTEMWCRVTFDEGIHLTPPTMLIQMSMLKGWHSVRQETKVLESKLTVSFTILTVMAAE